MVAWSKTSIKSVLGFLFETSERVAAGEIKASERAKQSRKRRRRVRKGLEDEVQQAEGQQYGAGKAD